MIISCTIFNLENNIRKNDYTWVFLLEFCLNILWGLSVRFILTLNKKQYVCFSFSSASIRSFQHHLFLISATVTTICSAINAKLRECYGWKKIQTALIYFSFTDTTFPLNDSLFIIRLLTMYCMIMMRSFC